MRNPSLRHGFSSFFSPSPGTQAQGEWSLPREPLVPPPVPEQGSAGFRRAVGQDGDGAHLLARVTRRSWDHLALVDGARVWAQVKGVSLERS